MIRLTRRALGAALLCTPLVVSVAAQAPAPSTQPPPPPPSSITETGTVLDAIVSFEMGHTWIGDLIATVTFQPACGGPSIGPVRLLCRQNRTGGCFNAAGGAGCSANIIAANDYEWSDAATVELGEPTCPGSTTNLASGCYLPDDDAPGINFPLSVFEGLDKAGCWTLNISDNAGADIGTLVSWTISLNNEVTPRGACCYADGACVDGALESDCIGSGGAWYDGLACSDISCVNAAEARSWGGVKSLYR